MIGARRELVKARLGTGYEAPCDVGPGIRTGHQAGVYPRWTAILLLGSTPDRLFDVAATSSGRLEASSSSSESVIITVIGLNIAEFRRPRSLLAAALLQPVTRN